MKQLKKWVPFTRRVLGVSAIMCVMGWGMYFGANYFPKTVTAQIVIPESTSTPPVLQRIEKCESNGSHYDKTGQVLMHVNSDKSVDVGEYQINSVWFATATKMGYDLTKKSDNEAFAKWLFFNKGTSDWSSSQSCWK